MEKRVDKYKNSHSTTQKILRKFLYIGMIIVTIALTGVMLGVGVAAGVVQSIVKDEKVRSKDDLDKDLKKLFETSYAYFQNKDEDGKPVLIGSLRAENQDRTLLSDIKEVSPNLTNAFISIEDRDFYKHQGIVPRSIIRAAYQSATNASSQTGGSTITQQLVKNLILNDRSKDLERKSKEIILALRLEQLYNKDEIIRNYMNVVHFGPGAHGQQMYGVKSAANGLFKKDVKDLNPAQAAYIAGMVQRPNALSPFYSDSATANKEESNAGLERGLKRMKLVLSKMKEYGYLNEKEYQEALSFNLEESLAKPEQFENAYSKYPFIMFTIEDEAAKTLMEKDGLNLAELNKQGKYRSTLEEYKKLASTKGYRFYTTLNEQLYNEINQDVIKGITLRPRLYPKSGKKYEEELGACVIENQTGAVLAFVPSTHKFDKNQKDHCFDVQNQPGSAIKPVLDYGPALELGLLSPQAKIVDEVIKKGGGGGDYKNANERFQGPVTVEHALKFSLNTPAIKTFRAVGQERAFNFIRQMGLNPHPHDTESAAIGGNTYGFTVEKMTASFATFANGGTHYPPFVISKIEDADGNVIFEHKSKPVEVFSPQTSYKITKMLRTVVKGGTASLIGRKINPKYDVAGKTGTSSDYDDLWFVGYTPKISIGVWAGYDYNMSMTNKDMAKNAWVNIFKAIERANPQLLAGKFSNPGNLGFEMAVASFDRARFSAWQETKRKEEEEEKKKKEEEEKEKEDGNEEGNEITIPVITPPGKPKPPGKPPEPGRPTKPDDIQHQNIPFSLDPSRERKFP
ncbi:transglycosylase domain-containing protein [Thermoactinomyces sp. DSM 45892]|uniref:transglycosylase domain-containing protein n=1 Tax=Thermoactinomyces sp. DSM 45892 TaxID=1882753 RepID=UPI000897EA3D|nr:transglycosylase domain-containing protein [Thermoactinomyces sp. DSM 45892]SDY27243.1 penicillin-binding protein [Thermoactinomyces sp. DSM 45892]